MDPTSLIAPQAVARRLQLSDSRVVQLHREGKLVAICIAGRRFYDPETVERFAVERERHTIQRRK